MQLRRGRVAKGAAARSMVPSTERDSSAKAARAAAANSAALRRHFAALTAALLAPFAPYLEPTPPPLGDGPVPPGVTPLPFCLSIGTFRNLVLRWSSQIVCTRRRSAQLEHSCDRLSAYKPCSKYSAACCYRGSVSCKPHDAFACPRLSANARTAQLVVR